MTIDNLEELFEYSRANPPLPTPRLNREEREKELNQGLKNYGLLIKLMDYVGEGTPRDQLVFRMQTAYELNLKEQYSNIEENYFLEGGFLSKYLKENKELSINQMEENLGTILSSMALFERLSG